MGRQQGPVRICQQLDLAIVLGALTAHSICTSPPCPSTMLRSTLISSCLQYDRHETCHAVDAEAQRLLRPRDTLPQWRTEHGSCGWCCRHDESPQWQLPSAAAARPAACKHPSAGFLESLVMTQQVLRAPAAAPASTSQAKQGFCRCQAAAATEPRWQAPQLRQQLSLAAGAPLTRAQMAGNSACPTEPS